VLKEISETYPQDAIYIFGHGRDEFGTSGSVEDLQIMANYLHALLEVVERDIKVGKSKKEVAQRESISGFPEHRAK